MYTERVRIYPNKTQIKLIDDLLNYSCTLYNKLLDKHDELYWLYGKSVNFYGYDSYARDICLNYDLKLPKVCRRYVNYRLHDAFERFFKKQNKYPKHKGTKKFRSFGTIEVGYKTGCWVRYEQKQIQLTKQLIIKANFTRPINGTPKTIIIKKMKSNIYYAFIQIDGNAPAKKIDKRKRKGVIAFDLGVNKFITDHLGNYISQPNFVEYNESNIRREQRKLSRMKRGSKNYRKQCILIAKMYERVYNIRKDFQYKLAYYLVTNYRKIICEDLHPSEMLKIKPKQRKLKKVRRLLSGCSFGRFLDILTHMCAKYGCQLIKVDPKYTSQVCSNCGALVYKKPNEHHNCPHCGLKADRDFNAARNIYERGMGKKFSARTAVNGAPAPLVLVNSIIVEKRNCSSKKPIENDQKIDG